MKAAEQTIDERSFWGLGEISLYPNLQSFSLTAEQKYQIQIVSSSKNILESWDESDEDEFDESSDEDGEPSSPNATGNGDRGNKNSTSRKPAASVSN